MTTTTKEAVPVSWPTRWAAYRWFWSLLITVAALDWASKWWIVEQSGFLRGVYPPLSGVEIIPGFFALVYATNEGAAWGMLQGMGWLLIALAALALAAIFWFRRALELRAGLPQVAFGLIVGGILGNTYDRLIHGHVIDFLDVDLGFYRWPTFNFADCGIVVGTGLYLLFAWRQEPPASAEA